MIDTLLAQYRVDRDVRESTIQHYAFVARSFAKHLGRPIEPADFNDQAINTFLAALKATHSPWTIRQRRVSLLVLWRAAADIGLVQTRPGRIRCIRTPDRVIETWTPEEIQRMIEYARTVRGTFRASAVSRAIFWECWLRVGYDSGLRQSDAFLLEATDVVNSGGRLVVVQFKTQFAVRIQLRPATMVSCRRLASHYGGRYLFPRLWKGTRFSKVFRRFVLDAGFEGTATKLRQSSCTEVERVAPGLGWIHLGHKSPATAQRWYTSRDRAYADRPLPPLLAEPDDDQHRHQPDKQRQHDDGQDCSHR